MNVTERTEGNVVVLQLQGRLDGNTAKDFEDKLLASIDKGEHQVALDLSDLDYIGSAGLRVMLIGAKRVKATKGMFVLSSLHPNVKEVFDISGFTGIFNVASTLAEALGSFPK